MLDLISAYENYLTKVKQASGNTVSSYMRDIRQFAGWLRDVEETDVVDATQLNISDFLDFLDYLVEDIAEKAEELTRNEFLVYGRELESWTKSWDEETIALEPGEWANLWEIS